MAFDPHPIGTWSGHKSPNGGLSYQFLHAGKRYVIIKEFSDYDSHIHPVGEKWIFLGYSFLPYDDGLSLFVSLDDKHEWHIRLQLRPEEQSHITDKLSEYIGRTL